MNKLIFKTHNFGITSKIKVLVRSYFCQNMRIMLQKFCLHQKIGDKHVKQEGKSGFDEKTSRTQGSREDFILRHGVFCMNTIPIVTLASLTHPLVPNDFSHSFGLLSHVCPRHSPRGCVLGNTGSSRWTPLRDTFEFLNFVRSSIASMCAMTESSFGRIIAVTDAAGNDIAANPVLKTSFTFTGREYDSDTNLYFLRARFLDASTGRFLQQDPEPGKLSGPLSVINKYIYTGNNPISFVDPSGRFAWLLIALIALGETAYQNNIHGGNFLEQFAVNFAAIALASWIGGNIFSGTEFTGTVGNTFWQAGQSLATQAALNSTLWELDNRHIINKDLGRLLAFAGGAYMGADSANGISVNQAAGNVLTSGSPNPGYNAGMIDWLHEQVNQWAQSQVPAAQ